MHVESCPALVLNADFRPLSLMPLSTLGWQDAVRAAIKGHVQVVANYDREIRSPSTVMKLPSVVALRHYVRPPPAPAFTRFNVFLRDRFRCAYCGEKHDPKQLTFDHLKPRSRGGETSWANILSACSGCNALKDDGHMEPLWQPYAPTYHQLQAAAREFPPRYLHESWLDFLYWDSELQP